VSHFETALGVVLIEEGGFSNHPRDRGGATQLGISLRAVRRLDAEKRLPLYLKEAFDVDDDGDIDEADVPGWTREMAVAFYRRFYWDAIHGDNLPWPLSLIVFDSAVNEGVTTAIKHLQRTVRVLEDGIFGAMTRLATERYSKQAPELLFRQMSVNRLDRYRGLDEADEFFRGWAGRTIDIYVEALKEIA
jgi:lysozyme family protein